MSKQYTSDDPGYVNIEEFIAEEWMKKINANISCCLNDLVSHCVKEKLTSKQHAIIYTKVMDGIRNIVDSRLKNFFSIENRYREEIKKSSACGFCTDESDLNSF